MVSKTAYAKGRERRTVKRDLLGHPQMTINVVEGDLLAQRVDAIVNPWHRNIIPWWLIWPRGVSGVIKRRGGVRPFVELGYRTLRPGQARVTGAGRLPFQGIIHVAALDLLGRATLGSVADSVRSVCALAVECGYGHIAMPVLDARRGWQPEEEALACALSTLRGLSLGLEVTVVRDRARARVGSGVVHIQAPRP